MRMSDIMNPDALDASLLGSSVHLPMKEPFGDGEHPVIQPHIVQYSEGSASWRTGCPGSLHRKVPVDLVFGFQGTAKWLFLELE